MVGWIVGSVGRGVGGTVVGLEVVGDAEVEEAVVGERVVGGVVVGSAVVGADVLCRDGSMVGCLVGDDIFIGNALEISHEFNGFHPLSLPPNT